MELVGSCSTFSCHSTQKSHKLRWAFDLRSSGWCKGSEMQNANGFHHAWTTFSFKTVYFLYLWDNLSPRAKQDQDSINPSSSATQNWLIILRIKWLSAEGRLSPVSLQLRYFRHLRAIFWIPFPAVTLSICDEHRCTTRSASASVVRAIAQTARCPVCCYGSDDHCALHRYDSRDLSAYRWNMVWQSGELQNIASSEH